MKAAASDAWRGPTIVYTKLPNTMDGKAGRRNAHGTNCTKRVSTAGRTPTDGGMKTIIVGIPNEIGTITTTTGGKLQLRWNDRTRIKDGHVVNVPVFYLAQGTDGIAPQ